MSEVSAEYLPIQSVTHPNIPKEQRKSAQHSYDVSVHLCQSAFSEYAANRFGVDKMNPTPNMTSYCSGIPIDSLPLPNANNPDL